MEALDGNAIAGELHQAFGREMTTERGSCKNCGDSHMVGELRVYLRAPGAVARCPKCGEVLMVLVTIRGETHIYMRGISGMEAPPSAA
jgi:uncharacterized Zn finger protein